MHSEHSKYWIAREMTKLILKDKYSDFFSSQIYQYCVSGKEVSLFHENNNPKDGYDTIFRYITNYLDGHIRSISAVRTCHHFLRNTWNFLKLNPFFENWNFLKHFMKNKNLTFDSNNDRISRNRNKNIRAWTTTRISGRIFVDQAKFWIMLQNIWSNNTTKRIQTAKISSNWPYAFGVIICSHTWTRRCPMQHCECLNATEKVVWTRPKRR